MKEELNTLLLMSMLSVIPGLQPLLLTLKVAAVATLLRS